MNSHQYPWPSVACTWTSPWPWIRLMIQCLSSLCTQHFPSTEQVQPGYVYMNKFTFITYKYTLVIAVHQIKVGAPLSRLLCTLLNISPSLMVMSNDLFVFTTWLSLLLLSLTYFVHINHTYAFLSPYCVSIQYVKVLWTCFMTNNLDQDFQCMTQSYSTSHC